MLNGVKQLKRNSFIWISFWLENHSLEQFAVANYQKIDAPNLVVYILIKKNVLLSDRSKTF